MSEDDWSDRSPSERARQSEPDRITPEGELLATLRAQPGRWHRVARDTALGWWFTSEARMVTRLAKADLIEYEQERTRGFRADVWVRALTPDERESSQEIRRMT